MLRGPVSSRSVFVCFSVLFFCLMVTDQRCPLLKMTSSDKDVHKPKTSRIGQWQKIIGNDFGFVDPTGSSGVTAPRAVGSRSKIYLSACLSIQLSGCNRPTLL